MGWRRARSDGSEEARITNPLEGKGLPYGGPCSTEASIREQFSAGADDRVSLFGGTTMTANVGASRPEEDDRTHSQIAAVEPIHTSGDLPYREANEVKPAFDTVSTKSISALEPPTHIEETLRREEVFQNVQATEADGHGQRTQVEPAESDGYPRALSDFGKVLAAVVHGLHGLSERVSELAGRLNERESLEETIVALSGQNQALNEKHVFFENVLPMLRCLIAIVDRIQAHQQRLQGELICNGTEADPECVRQQRAFLALAEANLADLETTLSALGVESYEALVDHFDPASQEWVGQVTTTDSGLRRRIAVRVSPGYRRGDYVIRRERVLVWALGERAAIETKGE